MAATAVKGLNIPILYTHTVNLLIKSRVLALGKARNTTVPLNSNLSVTRE